MSPTTKKKTARRTPMKKARPRPARRGERAPRAAAKLRVRASLLSMEELRRLIPYLSTVVFKMPKVVNVDWEDDDPGTGLPSTDPEKIKLALGDYVVWRNHTDVKFTIEFKSEKGYDWPFEGTRTDIVLPAKSDSAAYKVVNSGTPDAPITWLYEFRSPYDGGPGGPGVVVPGG